MVKSKAKPERVSRYMDEISHRLRTTGLSSICRFIGQLDVFILHPCSIQAHYVFVVTSQQ